MKKLKAHRLFYVLTLLGTLLLLLTGCGKSNKSSLQQIKERGTLRVGMISANPPYESQVQKNGKTQMQGADVLLVKKIAKNLGVKYELKTMDLDGLLPALQAKKVDMLVTSMAPTPERQKAAKFTDTYYKSTNVLVVPKANLAQYKNANNFKHATIAVVNNSSQQPMIHKVFPKATTKDLSKVTDLALAANNGKADAFCIDKPTATILLKKNPELTMTSWRHNDGSKGGAIALPKGTSDDLVNRLNEVIHQNKAQYSKWVDQYAQKGTN
ncbi:amino acid ABC transporter substrate-binding protein [Limosilactobacillus reuteri]|uniref:transporter substrate-binding domain-containing protein n=1 Tax=Lactobacillaceae TaxID=33958 RepID=UPI000B992C06|nr:MULTISPECIES: transporter substrate-binding domain-containing protein [Lactobacillaceae]OYS47036.1 amino acid ABC transporter substrate-binding protein [Limosilactobacillus reuteri]OYS50888.1 amino acid ABC transporter substrate-binding protein [Limosilactobacillus reuteri]OYS51787.1 amino acid ABC transporter substrate-binding protein [Limosilactobacillus reuteri]OYS53606.1 amino acid ABC transporter substrate-binding protein [Limosilactobacillus reuteri]OYS64431.1 amino acid ABC transport